MALDSMVVGGYRVPGDDDDFWAPPPADYPGPDASPAPSAPATSRLSSFGGKAPTPYQAFTEKFNAPTMPGDLMDQWGKTFAWDPSKVAENPAYKLRMAEEQKAVERSAAAKGNLITGGTATELQDRAAGVAASFMNDDFNREIGAYNTNFDTFTTDKNRRTGVFGMQFDQARAGYLDRANIHNQNESNRYQSERTNRMDDFGIFDSDRNFNESVRNNDFNMNRATTNDEYDRLFKFADYGFEAASGGAGLATNYGRTAGDLITQRGNATAAGQVGSGNAWQTGLSNVSDFAQGAAVYGNQRRGGRVNVGQNREIWT